jgi:hypothetical protein
MYSCHTCKKQFCGGNRINNIDLWEEYVSGRRTLGELATFNGCSERTIRRRLALVVMNLPLVFLQTRLLSLIRLILDETLG